MKRVPFLVGDVALVAGDAELEIDGREHVEEPVLDLEPKPRLVLDGAAGHPCEALLDGGDGVLGRQELLDVGFTEEQRHRAPSLGAWAKRTGCPCPSWTAATAPS